MPDPGECITDHRSCVPGPQWLAEYSRTTTGCDRVYVYRHTDDRRRRLILRNDGAWPAGREVEVADMGTMRAYELLDDPALTAVREVLRGYPRYVVLRYRPGKRLTVAAEDPLLGPVIVKCIANGANPMFERLRELQRVRPELDFHASMPYARHRRETVFVQQRLHGVEPVFDHRAQSARLVRRMALALESLHRSAANFENVFDPADQRRRTERYAVSIRNKFPSLSGLVDSLSDRLAALEHRLSATPPPIVPIHGSLHSHQWLVDGGELALVDFDRAAMGHAELDIATFLAEWDYESGELSRSIRREFVRGFTAYDPTALVFYRAHKHFAKAFKAAKDIDMVRAGVKCRRNLENAHRLLA